MTDQLYQRLGRVEEKLDKINEALIQMAHTEEKVVNLIENSQVLFRKNSDLEKRVRGLELVVNSGPDHNTLDDRVRDLESRAWIGKIVQAGIFSTVGGLIVFAWKKLTGG